MTTRALAVGTSIALGLAFAACGDTERDASTGPGSFSTGGSGGDTGEGGADAADSAPPLLEVCDGSPGLRLASRLRCPAWNEPGRLFIDELGVLYLFVDGQCHYWVRKLADGPHSDWYPTREGQLSREDAAALASDLRYSSWEDLVPWPFSDCADCCTYVLHDQSRAVSCYGDCGVALAQGDALAKAQEVDAATRAAEDWVLRLYDAGTPVDGPMRILVYADGGLPDDIVLLPWPLAEPIENFVFTGPLNDPYAVPPSFLITDPGETQILRQLRQELIDGQLGNSGDDHIIIESQGDALPWFLYMRDTVPLEDATGHVPEP